MYVWGGGGGGGFWTPVPLDPRILNNMKPLFCTCFRWAMHLRIKPDDVLGNPGVTHQSSQWVRNAVGTERVTTHAWVNKDDSHVLQLI